MRSANASIVGNSSGVKNCQGPGSTRDGGEAASGRHGSSPLMTPARAAAPLTRASAAPVKTSRRRMPSLMTYLVVDACANATVVERFQPGRATAIFVPKIPLLQHGGPGHGPGLSRHVSSILLVSCRGRGGLISHRKSHVQILHVGPRPSASAARRGGSQIASIWPYNGVPARDRRSGMRRRPLVYSLGALLLASLGIASAQNAYTSRPMNVRAGPNGDYPLVAQLDAGTPLDVHGCLDDWSWCDVSFEDNRGWIYAGGVSFVYQGGRVPLYSYGPSLGLPIITFSLMTYWGDYYRGRPWYAQRDTWSHRTLPPHRRPAGRPHAGPPPVSAGRPPVSHGRPSGSYGRPPVSGHPQPRGDEHGHAGSRRSRGGPPMPQHEQHPPAESSPAPRSAPAPRRSPEPRSVPAPRSSPMPAGHPEPGSHPEPRASQHGHPASPARGAPPQNRKPGSRPPEHPPQ